MAEIQGNQCNKSNKLLCLTSYHSHSRNLYQSPAPRSPKSRDNYANCCNQGSINFGKSCGNGMQDKFGCKSKNYPELDTNIRNLIIRLTIQKNIQASMHRVLSNSTNPTCFQIRFRNVRRSKKLRIFFYISMCRNAFILEPL